MNSAISEEAKLKAFYERDVSYSGLFFAAIKTTGIFCRVGCPARAPKPENIHFYDTVQEALTAGFRPCKVCKPLEGVGEVPVEIRVLLDEVHHNPEIRISNEDLVRRGIQPDTLRRWFKKHYGMTFQAYQRSVLMGHAVEQLKAGQTVTDVALKSYDSLSGFQDSFKQSVGLSPQKSKAKMVIFTTRISTPIGQMMVGILDERLCLLEFCDKEERLNLELEQIRSQNDASLMTAHHALFDDVQNQLNEYFTGQRKEFQLPLHIAGTPFQEAVWNALLTIPYGATCSYQTQANKIGRPDAVRAVARANGSNRIAIVIPCHRVIGSNGSLTGYGGGLERKRWLLSHEAQFGTMNLWEG
jgi:AraC family transcriptional regulator, regulatory protein of adaptative response / methylated-DNA-[protein]-cysteine methyltransferase